MREIRYSAVVLLGVFVDLLFVTISIRYFNFSPLEAAGIGIVLSSFFTFFLHDAWAFRISHLGGMQYRFVKFLLSCAFTFLVRGAVIFGFPHIICYSVDEVWIVVFAVGVSFIINFLLSKYIVFVR